MTRAAVWVAGSVTRALARVRAAHASAEAALGALLGGALSPTEREALGLWLYTAADPALPGASGADTLFPWEDTWFAARLPPAPARLLVGGAGHGREATVLRERGYDVRAYDPVPAAARELARRLGAKRAACARHEDLGAPDGPLATLVAGGFDAVIFGWGSLTHVLDAEARLRVVAAAAALTAGPILASVWTATHTPPSGRAERLGDAAGRTVGRLRGVSAAPPGTLAFAPWCGFGHVFTRDEIEALGRRIGGGQEPGGLGAITRETCWEPGDYPHFTWVTAAPRRRRSG